MKEGCIILRMLMKKEASHKMYGKHSYIIIKQRMKVRYYKKHNQECLASRQYYYKDKKLISVIRKHQ